MIKKIIITLGLLVGSLLAAWGANTLSGLSSGNAISNSDLFYDVQTPGVGGVKVTGSQFLSYVYGNVPTFTSLTIAGNLTSSTLQITSTATFNGSLITKVRSATATTASATTDYFLCLDPTSSTITLTLPGSPLTGLTYLVKDCTGQAATHNIIVTATNANIDGSGSFTMSTNYQSIGLTYSGTQWSVN